jgi:cyclohexadienyl dehydratase
VGTSGDYAPFSIDRDGKLEGYDVEIARRFARDTGRRLELVRFAWPQLVPDLQAGKFDVAMGGVTIRPERALVGRFTRPVAQTGAIVLTRGGLARSADDIGRRGVRLAVNAGGHLERVARRLFPAASIMAVPDNRMLPRLLRDGGADAVLTDDVEAPSFEDEIPYIARVGPVTHDRKAYLAADGVLADELDAWLRARAIDGTLDELSRHWLGPSRGAARTAFDSDLDALLALVDLRLAFMPAVAAAKETTGRPVEDAAQEARVLETAREQGIARGLDPTAVDALVRAQLAAARAAQQEFLATPRDRRPAVEALDLVREARPTLATLMDGIVARAADVARAPKALAGLDPGLLAAAFDPLVAPRAERIGIARAIVALRRSAPAPAAGPVER